MNTLILFSSKYGCTEQCAERLGEKLTGSVTLARAGERGAPDPTNYDAVILGSPIYIGAVSKEIRAVASDKLCVRRLGIFICCGFPDQADAYFTKNFSAPFLQQARATGVFGGKADLKKMSFPDRLIMKAATGGNPDQLRILDEAIDQFAQKMS